MNWQQRAEFVTPPDAEKRFHLPGIEIECARIDIGKHRTRTRPRNGAGRCKEAERRGENLISELHSSGDECQPQCVGSGRAPDCVTRSAEIRKLALERLNLHPQ